MATPCVAPIPNLWPDFEVPEAGGGSPTAPNATITSSDASVWLEWNSQFAAATSGVTYQTIPYDVTTSAVTNVVWRVWCADSAIQTIVYNHWPTWNAAWVPTTVQNIPFREPTDAELAEALRKGAETKARRELAEARARALLLDSLDDEQRRQFETAKTFEVLSRDGKRIYQVRYGKAGNVYLMKNGKPVSRFCIHPTDGSIPTEDVMLCQKLMIEGAEEEFLRIANRSAA